MEPTEVMGCGGRGCFKEEEIEYSVRADKGEIGDIKWGGGEEGGIEGGIMNIEELFVKSQMKE